MKTDKIYVGELNFSPEVCKDEEFADKIELSEITLREETVYDVDLTVPQKVKLAKLLDSMNIPILQVHARGVGDVIRACRDAGVRAQFEVHGRPYHSYGFADWKDEIRAGISADCDIIHTSITAPRKWTMGEPGMSAEGIKQRALEAVQFAFDEGIKKVTIGFTDVTRDDLNFFIDVGARAVELGAQNILINDTVGVAKPALIKYIVRTLRKQTKGGIRVHCHNDFGLATANTLAAFEAGAVGAEVIVNGADPARSGIAPLAEVVMGLLCLYHKDIGVVTEKLTEASNLFAEYTGFEIAEQKPVVADRNWMYKREHIMKTMTQDESIQFPYSPTLVGQSFKIGMGRGIGPIGVQAKLKELGMKVEEARLPNLVDRVTKEAIARKRRLTDREFKTLVETSA